MDEINIVPKRKFKYALRKCFMDSRAFLRCLFFDIVNLVGNTGKIG